MPNMNRANQSFSVRPFPNVRSRTLAFVCRPALLSMRVPRHPVGCRPREPGALLGWITWREHNRVGHGHNPSLRARKANLREHLLNAGNDVWVRQIAALVRDVAHDAVAINPKLSLHHTGKLRIDFHPRLVATP